MGPVINKMFSDRKSAWVAALLMRIGFADQPTATSQQWRLLEKAGQSDAGSHLGLHSPLKYSSKYNVEVILGQKMKHPN